MTANYVPPIQPLPPERNPRTERKHRRETLLQITFPMVIGVVTLLAASFAAVVGTVAQVSQRADASLIMLIVPMMVMGLVVLALNVATIYLIVKLVGWLPGIAYTTYGYLLLIQLRTSQFGKFVTQPVVVIQGWVAGLGVLVRRK